MRMEPRSRKKEPDYYGSLERLPIAPLKGKPPPYANRRKQDNRRGNLPKGNRGLSGSVGDLTSPPGRSRTDSSASHGRNWEIWDGEDGDLGIPLKPRYVNDAPPATPVHPHHQRHGSVLHSFSEHSSGGVGDVGVPLNPKDVSEIPSVTPVPQPRHQQHGSVSHSHLEQPSGKAEWRHSRNSDSNPTQKHITPGATPTPQLHHQRHGSVPYTSSGSTREDSDQRHKSSNNTSGSSTSHLPDKAKEQRHTGKDQSLTQNKTQHEPSKGSRNTATIIMTKLERPEIGAEETSDSDTSSPASTLERRQRSGSISNTNNLSNYRELAAIPDHTLVKWDRSKSMNDISTEDDAKDPSDKEERKKDEMKRAGSYNDTTDAVEKEGRRKGEMRYRERYTDPKDTANKEGKKDVGEVRHATRYSNTKDALDKEERSKKEARQAVHSQSARSKSDGQLAENAADKERRTQQGIRHTAQRQLVRSKNEGEVEHVREEKVIAERDHLIVNTHVSSLPPSSSNPSNSSKKNNQEGGSSVDSSDGVFVATPIFLEGSPSSSPASSPPLSPAAHQGSRVQGGEQDPLKRERESALSTLHKEILHLTRLKEEIELNLIKSQTELKEQVAGLREERGGLEALMEQREKRLLVQEEEIKDLKDTISQLQALVFSSDGEARLQRQASDLQEQLREEKRHHLEETIQLRREVRALSSRLQEKEEQLEKYKSDPALSSWGSRGLGKGVAESWKTSLPDVRKELAPKSSRGFVAERSRSFSSLSDCSDDSHFSAVGSFTSRMSRAKKDVSGSTNGSAVRSYKAVEPLGRPAGTSLNDERLDTQTVTSWKFNKAPVGEARPRGAPVWSDKGLESSVKLNGAPVSDYKVSESPKRSNTTAVPTGKFNKAPVGEARRREVPGRLDKEVEIPKKSNIRVTEDSASYSVPLRLETPLEPPSRDSNRRLTDGIGTDMLNIRSRKPLVISDPSGMTTLNRAPGSLVVPLGDDDTLSDTEDTQQHQTGDDGSRTKVKTTVYLNLGDYSRSGREDGRGGESENARSEVTGKGQREGRHGRVESREWDYGRSGGSREEAYGRLGGRDRDYGRSGSREGDYRMSGGHDRAHREWNYARSEGYEREPARTPHSSVTKTSAPPVPHHLHHPRTGSPPHRPNAPSPLPPPQATRSSAAPPQVTGTSQVTKQEPSQPSTYMRSQGAHPEVRSSRGVEGDLRTSWMYKAVDEPLEGVRRKVERIENGRRRETELPRGMEYGRRNDSKVEKVVNGRRRETELPREKEYGRRNDPEVERVTNGRMRETELPRGMEYGRRNGFEVERIENGRRRETELPRGVADQRRKDSELPRGNASLRSIGEPGNGTQGTSYIMATIQCLYNLPHLHHFFTKDFQGHGMRSEVAKGVAEVFGALESGTGDGRALYHLREAVGQRDKIFLLHQNPSAADFLSCLLAWLHSDLTPPTRPQASPASSVVSWLFHGLRESLIVCPTAGKVLSVAMESFNFLTLSVPGEGTWTLQELLTRRFQPQEMAWDCRLCGHRHPCSHQPRLLQPPRVLVLYLQRPSSGTAAARVLFPEASLVLHLQQQHHHSQQHPETRTLRSPEYQLVGVVTREGGEGSSISYHSAFCRRLGGGGWRVWGEQRAAAAVSRREVLYQQAPHLLFYIQQEEESQQVPGSSKTRGEVRRGGARQGGLNTFV